MVDYNTTEQQYRYVIQIDWIQEEVFSGGKIPDDTAAFWSGVMKYRNSMKEQPFYDLANYCLSCLSLPVSNAIVERIFSVVTSVKTKTRNRMSLRVLDAVVRIRSYFSRKDKCCREFVATKAMLDKFNVTMYNDDPLQQHGSCVGTASTEDENVGDHCFDFSQL